jgi:hypothetical protein
MSPVIAADNPATHLKCRNCSATYELAAVHVCAACFAPLEIGYDEDLLRRVTRASIEAGPQEPLALRGPAPRRPRRATRVSLGAGWTPLRRADRLAAALGMKTLWIKDDSANPTHSFKDRVVSVALSAARQLGFTTVACASTGNLAKSVAAHAAAPGSGRRAHPGRPREARPSPPGLRPTLVAVRAPTTTSTGSAARSPASRTGRSSTSTCGRSTPRAPRRWATRSPSSSAGGSRSRSSCRSPRLAADQGRQGFTELGRARADRADPVPRLRRAGRGLLPVSPPSPPGATPSPRSGPTRSPSRWRSATRPTAPTRSTSPAAPAARSVTSPTPRWSKASGCSPRPRASSPRRQAASPSPPCRSCCARVRSIRTPRRCSSTPATG